MKEVKELIDHKRIIELVDKFGGETRGLKKVNKAWVVLENNKEVGISGFIKINDKCWVLDPLAVKEGYRDRGRINKFSNKLCKRKRS